MMDKLLIGSHLDLCAPNYLLDTVKNAIEYGETTFMCYTGSPRTSIRVPLDKFNIDEAHRLMANNNIDFRNVVVHAPYIINIANANNIELYERSINILKQEIIRTEQMGFSILVLHPGAHLGNGKDFAISSIINALDTIYSSINTNVKIALETMAGKGSEIGTLDDLERIIKGVKDSSKLGVCLDTCHLFDNDYDITNLDNFLSLIEDTVGLDKILAIHINDSKNIKGSHKDRHENIGFGNIGFKVLYNFVHYEKFKDIPKILETPYINEKAPYREEIKMLKSGIFNEHLRELF